MSDKKHAILSPSGAHRWLSCTPSARFEQQFPDKSGTAAEEGTVAHTLGELLIKHKTKQITKAAFNKELKQIEADKYYDASMLEYAENYAVFVLETFANAQKHTKDALLFLEQKLNLTEYIPEGFGTGDAFIIADSVLDFIDLKYGKGVPVYATGNKQMMVYALGALREFDYMYDIKVVRMTIYQPRIDNISTWELSVEELKSWAENELKPGATLAFNGEGEFNPGAHCQFCRGKAVCKALADFNLDLAKHEFLAANVLSEEDVADILNRSAGFKTWISSVEEYALAEALNGKKWPGYKLVEGRSVRAYTDKAAIVKVLTENAHYDLSLITEPASLLGLTKLEKVVTKADMESFVSEYIVKPKGKPTLVVESDKRPEYSNADDAANDFANIDIDN